METLRRRFPLRWLIAGSFVLLFISIEGVLGAGLYIQLRDYLWRSSVVRLTQQVVDALRRTSPFPLQDEVGPHGGCGTLLAPPDLYVVAEELVNEMAGKLTMARVLNPDGVVIAEGGFIHFHRPLQFPPVEVDRLAEVRDAVNDPDQSALRHFRFHSAFVYPYLTKQGTDTWHVVLVPLTRAGVIVGYIQAAAPWQASLDLLEAFAGFLVLGTVLASGLGILVAFWVANMLTHPLSQLARVTRQVAAGDLTARTKLGPGANEIFSVAHDFDQMVGRVEDAFSTQRRFVADASHELKTPLTAIGGMAEILRLGMDEGNEDRRRRALQTIEDQVGRMNRLVVDLLTLSSVEQKHDIPRETFSLHALVDEARRQGSLLAGSHPFEVDEKPGDAMLYGNFDRLLRVLNNLFDNAFKYSAPGGAVTFLSRVEAGRAWLTVTDQGVGIAAEDLPHVFDRFYRADPSRTRKTGGTGLGLSIVSAIVEAHRGTVTIRSTPGQGTTVEVRLPVSPATPPETAALPAPGATVL